MIYFYLQLFWFLTLFYKIETFNFKTIIVQVLSNPRRTYMTPPGEGFQPRETAQHHRNNVLTVLREALDEADITPDRIDAVAYTKGKLEYYIIIKS